MYVASYSEKHAVAELIYICFQAADVLSSWILGNSIPFWGPSVLPVLDIAVSALDA